jgi:small-conductance mechanosensitive channel/CRP-like cAMP-binding protein
MSAWSRLSGEPAAIVFEAAALALVLLTVLRLFLPTDRRHRGGAGVVCLVLAMSLAAGAALCAGFGLMEAQLMLRLGSTVALLTGLIALAGLVLFDLVLARAGVNVSSILRDLLQAATAVVVILAFLRLAGLDLLPLLTTSAVLTAVIGLALQTSIANIFGGLALQLDRTVDHGDWIQVAGQVGRIMEIGWRSTRMITKDGDTIFVPNGQLVTGDVLNFSRPTGAHRVTVRVGFHYRHPPHEISRVMLGAIRDTPGVLAHPPPDCLPLDFGESALVYAVHYWIAEFERDVTIDGDVRARIWYAARRAGLEIPFPIQTQIITAATMVHGESADEHAGRLRLLTTIELFSPLDDEDREALARGMRRFDFGAGERIVRQGEAGDSLFVVHDGEVGVQLAVDGASREIATLHRGEVFGEMSLMTGAPRTTTCTARTEVTCYVIERAAFQAIVVRKPALAEQLSAILAAREVSLDAHREGLSAAARALRAAEHESYILPRIRSLFRLDP